MECDLTKAIVLTKIDNIKFYEMTFSPTCCSNVTTDCKQLTLKFNTANTIIFYCTFTKQLV